MGFDAAVKTKVMLWSDRHCCLCKNVCGVNIEVHHIVPESEGGSNDIDNALPLCFNCHSEVHRYNRSAPIGNKYKAKELKIRRDQVYEEFTRHLVPPVYYCITNVLSPTEKRLFPDTGFNLVHHGDSLPVRVQTVLEIIREGQPSLKLTGHYGGDILWNLNPRFQHAGHFTLPDAVHNDPLIRIRVSVAVTDQYDRVHDLLPVQFVYVKEGDYWFFEP